MFAALEPEARQRVIAAAVPRTYRKGQLLFVENDPGESLIVLRRGAVAGFRTSSPRERAGLNVVRPPHTNGEGALLDAGAPSPAAAAIEGRTPLARSPGPLIALG